MKLVNYILLGVIVAGIILFLFYRGNMNSKIETANTLKEEWRMEYINLLNASVSNDTLYKTDTIYITRKIKAIDSIYVRDTVEVCNYVRTYRDSIVKPNLTINYGLVTQGVLLDSKFVIKDTRPTIIENKVVYRDKIVEKEVLRNYFYLDLGYNFKNNPAIGLTYMVKGKWGVSYRYNDGHTLGLKIRL